MKWFPNVVEPVDIRTVSVRTHPIDSKINSVLGEHL